MKTIRPANAVLFGALAAALLCGAGELLVLQAWRLRDWLRRRTWQ